MKKVLAICLACLLLSASCALAEEYDLPNMTRDQLNTLVTRINKEIQTNHQATSAQTSAVESAVKTWVNDYYGEDNVSWAWFDYSYARDWNFFTMSSHADITKKDGGKAQYSVYGEVYATGGRYETVYIRIGNEVIFDEREGNITDARVLAMLGLTAPDGLPEEAPDTPQEDMPAGSEAPVSTPAPTQTVEAAPVAKRGDKNNTVKAIQEMLIRLNCLSGSADGDFGGKTEQAVKDFQAQHGFTADGIVTQQVYDALQTAFDAAPVPVVYPKFTAAELYKKFESNQVAAKAELKGQVIEVTGRIDTISESVWGIPYVSLAADAYGFNTICCYFSKDDTAELAGLQKGEKITIRGTCDNMNIISVDVDNCEIVR